MELHLTGAGTFPHAVIARVLWAGIGGDLDSWRRVAAADQQPHVTVARTRERTDLTGPVTWIEGTAVNPRASVRPGLAPDMLRTRRRNRYL
jgi:2'-5' RNA ligase